VAPFRRSQVVIQVPGRWVTVMQLFGDVDAGETRSIPLDQSCILPIVGVSVPAALRGDEGDSWSCSRHGAPGPFSFTVELREIDEWMCPHSRVWTCEVIGRHEVVYSMEELIALHVGQELEESVRLSPPCPVGQDVCEASDTKYQFAWRIIRIL
jgi:hypothetical protein